MSISSLLVLAARRFGPIELHLNECALNVCEANFPIFAGNVEPYAIVSVGNDPAGDCVPLRQSHRN
jgi:hypothetical protein